MKRKASREDAKRLEKPAKIPEILGRDDIGEDPGQSIDFEIVKDDKGRLILHTVGEHITTEDEYNRYPKPFFVSKELKAFLKEELLDRGAAMRNDQEQMIYLTCNPQDIIHDDDNQKKK